MAKGRKLSRPRLRKKFLPRRALGYTKENLLRLPRARKFLPRRIKEGTHELLKPREPITKEPAHVFLVSFVVNCSSGVHRRGHHGHRDLRRVHRVRHLDDDAGHHYLRLVGHRVPRGLRRDRRSVQDDRPRLAAQVRRG